MMEKLRQSIKKTIINESAEQSQQEIINKPKSIIWGWKDINEVASDVWCSIHNSLLSGNLIFAFRNTGGLSGSDLVQLVITRNVNDYRDFAVGVMTTGYSMLLPHIPIEYLSTDLLDNMKDWKIKKDILKTYEEIIKIIENEIISN